MLAPTIAGPDGPVAPTCCRLSRDLSRLAFWVPEANPPGLFVGETEQGDQIGASATRVWSAEEGSVSDLAWSGDGAYVAFLLSSGPPPGELRVGVLRVADRAFTILAGQACAWAGNGATLLIADPASSRLYLKDMDLGVEHRICEMSDDGDPHFAPVISVSPDQRRFALVTRRVREDATHVHMAQHDGREWHASPLTEVPGTSVRILPFWSADSAGFALYVIDIEQRHTAMIGVPEREGQGDILYTSDSIDGFITPAPHPDGRLIAFCRAHPGNRLVLLDPVEHSVAAITSDEAITGNLRWVDAQTLLVEGAAAVWTVKLRAAVEAVAPVEEEPARVVAAAEGFVRTVVQDVDPNCSFVCDLPTGWQRVPLPAEEIDFTNPTVMRPLCVFTPNYATMIFTVATRPMMPGATAAVALRFLSQVQGFEIGEVENVILRCGRAAQTFASQRSGDDVMKMRLVMIEDGGNLFSISVMAPEPLWNAVEPTLAHIIESFCLVVPQGPTTPTFD